MTVPALLTTLAITPAGPITPAERVECLKDFISGAATGDACGSCCSVCEKFGAYGNPDVDFLKTKGAANAFNCVCLDIERLPSCPTTGNSNDECGVYLSDAADCAILRDHWSPSGHDNDNELHGEGGDDSIVAKAIYDDDYIFGDGGSDNIWIEGFGNGVYGDCAPISWPNTDASCSGVDPGGADTIYIGGNAEVFAGIGDDTVTVKGPYVRIFGGAGTDTCNVLPGNGPCSTTPCMTGVNCENIVAI